MNDRELERLMHRYEESYQRNLRLSDKEIRHQWLFRFVTGGTTPDRLGAIVGGAVMAWMFVLVLLLFFI